MSWKDINKSSYQLNVGKYGEWAPSRPFSIPYQGAKVRYSEGDEISSVASPIFNVEFTGDPLGPDHFPCGYWHKNYIPPVTTIYTSRPYPIETLESITSSISIIGGVFRDAFHLVELEDYVTSSIVISGGSFRTLLLNIELDAESILVNNVTISSGTFDVKRFDGYAGPESIVVSDVTISGGELDTRLIQYTYGLPDSIGSLAITITGGSHAAA